MNNSLEMRCAEADCAHPNCDCWEIKRKNNPARIQKLEDALRLILKPAKQIGWPTSQNAVAELHQAIDECEKALII